MSKPKLDWIDLVDRALERTDRALDKFRKTPRRRLATVPTPLVPANPFEAAKPAPSEAAATAADADAVKPLGDPNLPAQVYGRRTCDKTARVVQYLRERSVVARSIDLDDPDNRDLENRLIRETKRYETPYIYMAGKFIGGFDELAAHLKKQS